VTLLTAFVRHVGQVRELVMASDSRLSGGGQQFDQGQKIFQLPRSDALIGFAGDTSYAYPLLQQMVLSIGGFAESRDRRMPLARVQGHTLRVFRQCYEEIHGFGPGQTKPLLVPDNYFLFGGFDWHSGNFHVWRLVFNEFENTFEYARAISPTGLQFIFVGDDVPAVKGATRRTAELLRENGRKRTEIDLEPLTALQESITGGLTSSIGGAPQLAKSYRHLNTQLFQVIWPDRRGVALPHIAGRAVQPPEVVDFPVFDPSLGFYSRSSIARTPSSTTQQPEVDGD
jgi:hypothetical protein